jgi:hypothetical protein
MIDSTAVRHATYDTRLPHSLLFPPTTATQTKIGRNPRFGDFPAPDCLLTFYPTDTGDDHLPQLDPINHLVLELPQIHVHFSWNWELSYHFLAITKTDTKRSMR